MSLHHIRCVFFLVTLHNYSDKEMKVKILILLFLQVLGCSFALADTTPNASPSAVFKDAAGNEHQDSFEGSAPVTASFKANPQDIVGWTAYYEWRFFHGNEVKPYLQRYEEDTQYTFDRSGNHRVILRATFISGNDTIIHEYSPITVSLFESRLELPNAFSPNGDGINDVYKVKSSSRSIIEFHAKIYNRWGQKLYEWDSIDGGWDGKFHGKDVAQGVYYVVVEALGADGKRYSIKRDINLLRNHTVAAGYGRAAVENRAEVGGGHDEYAVALPSTIGETYHLPIGMVLSQRVGKLFPTRWESSLNTLGTSSQHVGKPIT